MNLSDFLNGNKKLAAGAGSTNAAQYEPPDSLKYPQPVNVPTPDWEDVRQEYPEYSTVTKVPVCIDEPVVVWDLPAKRSVLRSFHIPAVNAAGVIPVEIIPADPRIKNAFVTSDGANPGAIFLGTMEQVTGTIRGDSDAYFYNGSTPLGPWQGFQEPVYAIAQTGTSVNIVNIRLEYWAD